MSDRDEIYTGSGEQGLTVAALVRELAPGLSWSQARELCRGGKVWIDGQAATDPARRLAGGERVEIRSGAARSPELIVHLDSDVAVVRKPAGILTVPFERQDRDTLLALARVAIRRMESARGPARGQLPNPTLRAVQRLDKETSGLVVFARSLHAQRHLQEQLAEHTVTRRYLAIAHGKVEDGTYDSLLVPDRGDGLRGSWNRRGSPPGISSKLARQAVTYVRVKQRLNGATLVICELETGRQHQIRIHLAEAGHPLVGETVYIRDYRGPILPAPRPMLHATVLGFRHPRGDRPMSFEDPPPPDFLQVLERLKP
ncbi:MAG: RluA family pseudouridine synthase [Thermoanaerobaculia bacterium]